jgi:hypothetical protein
VPEMCPRFAKRPESGLGLRKDVTVIWRNWPVQKRVLMVTALVTAYLGVFAVRAWLHGNERWAAIACGLMVVGVLGGGRLVLKARRDKRAAD